MKFIGDDKMVKISYDGWVGVDNYIKDLFYDDGINMVLDWDSLLRCNDRYEKLKAIFEFLERKDSYDYVMNPEIVHKIYSDKELWCDDVNLIVDRDGQYIYMEISFFNDFFRFLGEVQQGYYEGNLVYRNIELLFTDDFVGGYDDTNISYMFYPEGDVGYEIENFLDSLLSNDINDLIKRILS